MKALFIVVAAIALLTGCGRIASEADAKALAQERFVKVCSNFHLSPSNYDGPIRTEVGGARFAYEWRVKGKKADGILITMDNYGVSNVAFLR